ncbi:carbonic anhydrase [bacterium]|nr:MAG: carbonic anhydrase [bacterium]
MRRLSRLFENNLKWAEALTAKEPAFFSRLADLHEPEYLWIGCSDSRVPANEIVGLLPGDLFVHRNVGNVVSSSDLNCLSVLQYAIQILKVRHVIVTGHYGCGGVKAALDHQHHGLIDNWLRPIRDAYVRNQEELDALSFEERVNRLCEINVLDQVQSVCRTSFVQEAWAEGRELAVHGWIYDIHDGILKDLGTTLEKPEEVPAAYRLPKKMGG